MSVGPTFTWQKYDRNVTLLGLWSPFLLFFFLKFPYFLKRGEGKDGEKTEWFFWACVLNVMKLMFQLQWGHTESRIGVTSRPKAGLQDLVTNDWNLKIGILKRVDGLQWSNMLKMPAINLGGVIFFTSIFNLHSSFFHGKHVHVFLQKATACEQLCKYRMFHRH